MSVRVVARVRPLLKTELSKDTIVQVAGGSGDAEGKSIVRIPNPKNEAELYSFQFNSVYDQDATQAQIFDAEVAPTVKHLFKGCDVTLFAYGVTGTGKTHTMRGGKSLADRGVIPRLLSSIYRRARKTEKDAGGDTTVEVVMSYYEIYNDRVFDLFEPPEKRTPAGLPIRDVGNGKTQVVGLTERPCTTLKEFEKLYDEANVNRSTSATKLNAHSSRSHAILCVKVIQTTGAETRVATASAIDLAGSEDNRRTDNNKERLVESASINKSLFVLAQCVEAISKKQNRIPYRESKMTRILSLGQNNGFTVMILNLSPLRAYHLDTLSSLNFANRTKKIEVNEIENQPIFRNGKTKLDGVASMATAPSLHRQPLRSKILSQNSQLSDVAATTKPAKQFAVFTDKPKSTAPRPPPLANTGATRTSMNPPRSPKRIASSESLLGHIRPSKIARPNDSIKAQIEAHMSRDAIEALIERKVSEALAERADHTTVTAGDPISNEVQRRLDALEKRVEGKESARAEGLQYLLMGKQHQVRGEESSALKMYQLALPHFPENEKLVRKIAALQDKLTSRKSERRVVSPIRKPSKRAHDEGDESYQDEGDDLFRPEDSEDDDNATSRRAARPQHTNKRPHQRTLIKRSRSLTSLSEGANVAVHEEHHEHDSDDDEAFASALTAQTPRTKHILHIINTRDVSQIRLLKGVGAKKAEAIVNCLCDLDLEAGPDDLVRRSAYGGVHGPITSLHQLGKLKGVGVKTVENMRAGLTVE